MRNRFVLLADLALIAGSAFVAFALRFDLAFVAARPEFVPFLLAALVVKPVVFLSQGMYGRFWRYASLNDMLVVVFAASLASVLLAVLVGVAVALGVLYEFSRAVLLIDWLVTLVTVVGVRAGVRIAGESRLRARGGRETHKRVLIVGAGEAGASSCARCSATRRSGWSRWASSTTTRPSSGNGSRRRRAGARRRRWRSRQIGRVDEVVIAMPHGTGCRGAAVAERARAGLRRPDVPGCSSCSAGRSSVNRLRQVEITDLLRRDQVRPHVRVAASTSPAGVVLVTGAGGSIGSELCRQVAHARPGRLVLLGHGENSIFEIATASCRDAYPDVHVVPVHRRHPRRERAARRCSHGSGPTSSSTPPRTSTCR